MEGRGSAGARFRAALEEERPLQVVGVINAYCAILAEHAGFRALYLSGAGVANASLGVPDLGMVTLNDVLTDVRRITGASELPVLVDAETGFGDIFMVGRTVREILRAGAAGIHIEDQIPSERSGLRQKKVLLGAQDMVDRIKIAVDARADPDFVIMAKTDAVPVGGLEAGIERACRYAEAGADMIFPEALSGLEQYRRFAEATTAPVLANMTDFGQSPWYEMEELVGAGVRIVLYPLTAFRAMSAAAEEVYTAVRRGGTRQELLPRMQTRDELHAHLSFLDYEQCLERGLLENGDDGY